MPLHPLTTQIVGSYAKPHWLARHSRMGAHDGSWWRPDTDVLQGAKEDAALLAIYEQERAGLDLVTDGEAQRAAYDRHFLKGFEGIDYDDLEDRGYRGAVAASRFDDSGHEEFAEVIKQNPQIKHDLTWAHPVALNELRFLKAHAKRRVKVTVIGALTLSGRVSDHFYNDEDDLIMAMAAGLNRELRALDEEGVDVLQIDEPGFHFRATTAMRIGKAAIERMVEGIKAPVVVHSCYGYAIVHKDKSASASYPGVLEILSDCPIAGISIEYEQPGHEPSILKYCGSKHIVLGLLDLSKPVAETPDHVANRLRAALECVPPDRLHPASDCGMWYLPRALAFAKIKALVDGTEIVRKAL